jgi:lipoate:protein ligase-like protein
MGESLLRTSGGMLRVYLAVSRGTVKSAWITGDFFATTPAVASLESSLKWRPVVRQELLAAVEAEYRRSGGIAGVREEELTNAVFEAGERAEAGT